MKSSHFPGDRHIRLVVVPTPAPAPGEVLLRVRRTALCGSDAKPWLKGDKVTPGHEMFAVVDQPGHRLHGQRSLVYIPVHCGQCASCRRGDTHTCETQSTLMGWDEPGRYAQALAVAEQCLLPVPEDIEDDLAPLLLDTIGTTAHAIRFVAPLLSGARAARVWVLSVAPVGLGGLLALQHMGLTHVAVGDLCENRLALAQSFCARVHPVGDASQRFDLILRRSRASIRHCRRRVPPRR